MRPEKGVLIVLSGPSGSGKGTLVKKLLEQRDDTVLSVSVTTRQPRPGEIEGVHYYFRTRKQVMNHRSDLVSIFITIPSMKELEQRLRGRGTETEESIQGRLQVARQELSRAFRYQYVVLNDEVDRAVERIQTIIEAEKMRYAYMEDLILEVMNDAQAQ